METLEKYGQITLKYGEKADEVVGILINSGFEVCIIEDTFTTITYEIFKKTK